MIQLTLTLKMTTTHVVEKSVTVNKSPTQGYVHQDDHTQPTYEMTPGFKPFTVVPVFANLFLSPFSDMMFLQGMEVVFKVG